VNVVNLMNNSNELEKEDPMRICFECASRWGGIGCLSRLGMARGALTEDEEALHLRIYKAQVEECPLKKAKK